MTQMYRQMLHFSSIVLSNFQPTISLTSLNFTNIPNVYVQSVERQTLRGCLSRSVYFFLFNSQQINYLK
jgi:hypothetical protein